MIENVCKKCVWEKLVLFWSSVDSGWSPRYSKGIAKISFKEHQYLRRNYEAYSKSFDERKNRTRDAKGRYETKCLLRSDG